jgi:hypothetical protein
VTTPPLIEGLDYYIENGLMVFTAHYLRNRGYCCQSGCRHCPYGYKKQDEENELRIDRISDIARP